MTQQIDAKWRPITMRCQDGHYMAIVAMHISRFGNIRTEWFCATCQYNETDERNIVLMLADCTELDMLSSVITEEAA